jgi:ubiquinone/menaquinone biosynthesis C-methylase UbiE/uncharacterized protein YbaR (Trm112 family)
MRRELLEYLRCPATHSRLQLVPFEEDDRGNVTTGLLSAGPHIYPIIAGVPSMLPNNVPPHFAEQARAAGIDIGPHVSARKDDWSFSDEWSAFFNKKVTRTWIWDIQARQRMFFAETGIQRDALAGKFVLDAGCGNGQLTDAIGNATAVCIGLDFSTSVFHAEKERVSARTHFVRGDLANPPFDARTFDLIYCSGVLHHTPNTRATFASVSRLAKDRGIFYCWLYRFDSRPLALFYAVITEIIRPFASRAPRWLRDLIVKTWAAGLWLGYRITGRGRNHSYEELVVASYDVLTPRHASRHTPVEVAGWFHENGFGAAHLTHWDNPNGFGMVASRAPVEETPGIHFGQSANRSPERPRPETV